MKHMKSLYNYLIETSNNKKWKTNISRKMKKINVTISGICNVYWIESILDMDRLDTDKTVFQLEEEEITDMDSFLEAVVIKSGLEVEVDGVPISKKGKYIKRKDYYSKLITNPSVANLMYSEKYLTQEFEIELEDGEEFDPMKLQLVKTDYELDFIPYGILTSVIVYNGKEIEPIGGITDGLMFNLLESYVIDYDLPYVK